MNQEKIGKFIAECRKKLNLTQQKLADKLGITDRAISNWENGISLPDPSLYRLICDILHISINELFAGEYISDESYKNVADENLLLLLEHKLYDDSSKEISFDEFLTSLKRISEFALFLKKFKNKQEAIKYLVNETGLPDEECSSAYDIYIKMFEYK